MGELRLSVSVLGSPRPRLAVSFAGIGYLATLSLRASPQGHISPSAVLLLPVFSPTSTSVPSLQAWWIHFSTVKLSPSRLRSIDGTE